MSADNFPLSRTIRSLQTSPTLALHSQAKSLQQAGRDIVDLCAGELELPPPSEAAGGAVAAIQQGHLRYDHPAGLKSLRERLQMHFQNTLSLNYAPEHIIVTSGAKQAIYLGLLSLLDPGDQVVIPIPYWVSFPEMVKLAGGTPVLAPTRREDGHKLTPETLAAHCNDSTKLLILNSPNNPSGAVYSREQLHALWEIIREKNLYCVSDEIYSSFHFEPSTHFSLAQLGKDAKSRTLIVQGFSKSFAMTGYRLGFAAGPAPWLDAMIKIQGQTTHHPSLPAQYAALGALGTSHDYYSRMLHLLKHNRRLCEDAFASTPLFKSLAPEGAFYYFTEYAPEIPANQKPNSADLCRSLLEEEGVAVVPGSAFGMEHHFRISFACGKNKLKSGLSRILAGVHRILSS